jgi:peptidyl-prolyl cis-trans isomerase B (cyclophilin B)
VHLPRTALVALCVVALSGAAFAASGCAGQSGTTTGQQSATPEQPTGMSSIVATSENQQRNQQGEILYTPTYQPSGNEVAVIKTSKGTITVKLYGKDAPVNVGSFIELAKKGFYNKVKFHRLEPGFVVQGGDPQTRPLSSDQVKQLVAAQNAGQSTDGQPVLGTGGPGYAVKGEFQNNPNKHVDGTLAVARTNDPDSAGSQFYFTLAPQPPLDNNYTVIGQTTGGLDVVHKLAIGDVIESITIENASK